MCSVGAMWGINRLMETFSVLVFVGCCGAVSGSQATFDDPRAPSQFASVVDTSMGGSKPLDVSSPIVVKASEFALSELRGLSEYYCDIHMKVLSAEQRNATLGGTLFFLKVELNRGGRVSSHEIMVLERREDDYDGFAIDTFPEVPEALKDEDVDERF